MILLTDLENWVGAALRMEDVVEYEGNVLVADPVQQKKKVS